MPVTNKIQIGVEVVNQTAAPLSKIKTDIGNMSKSMQASLGATNTLISQGMIKAASTIEASTKAASISASGSFQTIQFNAQNSAASVTAAYSTSAKEIASDWREMQDYVKKDTGWGDIINKVKDNTESLSKGFQYLIVEINKSIEAYKEQSISVGEHHNQVQSLLALYKELRDQSGKTNEELNKHLENYNKTLKQNTDEVKKSTQEHTKQANAVSGLAKRFLTIAAAIYIARRAYQMLISSAKVYEEQAGKGGTGALARIADAYGQMQVEIGSVFEKTLTQLADYFDKNKESILAAARQITAVLLAVGKIVAGVFGVIQNSIYEAIAALSTGLLMIMRTVMVILSDIVKNIPLMPEAIKKGFEDASKAVDGWLQTALFAQEESVQGIIDSSKLLAEGAKELWKAIVEVPVASGIKFINEKDKQAIEEFKKRRLELLAWLAQFQDKYNSVMLSEVEYRRTQIDGEYKKYLLELDQFEKDLGVDLSKYKLMVARAWAKEDNNIDKEVFDKKVERINEIEQRQKDAYEAAKSAAKSAGIGMGTPMLTPGSRASALGSQAFTGQQAIADQIEEMNKAYDAMVATGMYKDTELAQARIDIETNTTNALKQLDYDLLQTRMSNAQETMSMYTNAASMITDIANTMTETQLNNLAKETEARYEALDVAFKADTKFTKNKGKLEKQYADEKEKIQKEQEAKEKEFRNKQKGWSIAQASISGAEAIMNAWVQAMKLPSPVNMIMGSTLTALITASTAAQIANIESQKFAKGGIVDGPRTGDQVQANVNGGEMILTNQQQAALWGKLSSGSYGSSSNISIGGDTIVVQGNMDKDAADRLIRNRNERMKLLKDDIRELSYRGQLAYA